MSAPLIVSAELSASIQRMKARTWRDADAEAFEQGAIPTRAASKARHTSFRPLPDASNNPSVQTAPAATLARSRGIPGEAP